ncbi:TIGR01777 family oxidoreductase [Paenibacillus koleovorans]|uniref:TIGR01777 family oxidoreductase n=1 Tax=Paenibacillus koleovorans TaxID=121608 RepID=UPI000FDC8069|nr:TIGR01777 family oxidoreductase [Paenibacillus koleovorans]
MRIAVAGGSGFVGKHLIKLLREKGDEVVLISRSRHGGSIGKGGSSSGNGDGNGGDGNGEGNGNGGNGNGTDIDNSDGKRLQVFTWDELLKRRAELEGLDAIVNLSGESVNQRWTKAAKHRILHSRLETAALLGQLVDALERKPAVVVNGSGMSIYGTSETDEYDERSPKRITDFLASVVDQWEQAADAHIRGVRLVKLRIGLVLGTDGGALPPMAMPYKLGVGGRVGSGRHWMSWIHVRDMARLIYYCVENASVVGPVNATGPKPVRNDEFGRALGYALGRPHWMPVPAVMLKLLFGELSVLLLEGQKVMPRAALDYGFHFKFNTLEEALGELYGRKP